MNWYDVISIIACVINHLLWLGGSQPNQSAVNQEGVKKEIHHTILGDKYFFLIKSKKNSPKLRKKNASKKMKIFMHDFFSEFWRIFLTLLEKIFIT